MQQPTGTSTPTKLAVLLLIAAACPSRGAETYCQRVEQLLCECIDREEPTVKATAAVLLPCIMQQLSAAHVQQPSNAASQNIHVGLQLLERLVKYVWGGGGARVGMDDTDACMLGFWNRMYWFTTHPRPHCTHTENNPHKMLCTTKHHLLRAGNCPGIKAAHKLPLHMLPCVP